MSKPDIILTWITSGNETRGNSLAAEYQRTEAGRWKKVCDNNPATRACLEELKHIRRDQATQMEQMYRDREIVKSLLTTADGVPIAPLMKVWTEWGYGHVTFMKFSGTFQVTVKTTSEQWQCDPSDCYSTEAALKGAGL